MKHLFLALTLAGLCAGCSGLSYLTPTERARIASALDAHRNHRAVVVGRDEGLITTETKFASKCPYDGTLTVSKRTAPFGCHTAGGTNFQEWCITFICPRDGMVFSDRRVQIVPDTRSLRLPLIGTATK